MNLVERIQTSLERLNIVQPPIRTEIEATEELTLFKVRRYNARTGEEYKSTLVRALPAKHNTLSVQGENIISRVRRTDDPSLYEVRREGAQSGVQHPSVYVRVMPELFE